MRTKTPNLVRAAILVALAVALSFAKLWEMPLGGAVTFGSMLPIMLLSIALGVKWGLAGSCVFVLFQLAQSIKFFFFHFFIQVSSDTVSFSN